MQSVAKPTFADCANEKVNGINVTVERHSATPVTVSELTNSNLVSISEAGLGGGVEQDPTLKH